MAILSTTDFNEGRYYIPLSPEEETKGFPKYIERVENSVLPELFGVELYDLFIADLALPVVGEPTDPRFVKVYNEFNYQGDGLYFRSQGIKEMLRGFVYYDYLRDQQTRVTTVGLKRVDGSNSETISGIQHDLNSRYNESIETFHAIQCYMDHVDPDTYPEYDGIYKPFNHTF